MNKEFLILRVAYAVTYVAAVKSNVIIIHPRKYTVHNPNKSSNWYSSL